MWLAIAVAIAGSAPMLWAAHAGDRPRLYGAHAFVAVRVRRRRPRRVRVHREPEPGHGGETLGRTGYDDAAT